MNLQEIAESISSEDILSYNKHYRKLKKKKIWLYELLEHGYVALHDKVKIHTENHEWLPWEPACTILDKIVMSVSYIYERKIAQLEKENDDLKLRLKSSQ